MRRTGRTGLLGLPIDAILVLPPDVILRELDIEERRKPTLSKAARKRLGDIKTWVARKQEQWAKEDLIRQRARLAEIVIAVNSDRRRGFVD